MSFVHNHGPGEGQGLDCAEFIIGDNRIGRCLLTEADFIQGARVDALAPANIVGPSRTLPAGVYYADWDGTIRVVGS